MSHEDNASGNMELLDSGSRMVWARHGWVMLVTLFVVLISTRFGGLFSLPPSNISAFWPANALLFSLVFLMPKWQARSTLLLAFPTYVLAELWLGYPLRNAIFYGLANVAEVTVLLLLLSKTMPRPLAFDTLNGLFTLLMFAFLASPVGGAIGAIGAMMGGAPFGSVFFRWGLADFFGYCLLVPLILTWGQWRRTFAFESLTRILEFAVLLVVLIVVAVFSSGARFLGFSAPLGAQFLPMPLLLWAALRFGPPGGAIATVSVACIAFFSATHGVGLFAIGAPEENVASLQLFFASLVVSVMTIASLNAERKKSFDALQQEVAERIQAEESLRESEAKYRRIVDMATEGIWLLGPDAKTAFVNARVAEILGCSCEEMMGRPATDFMFEEDVPDHLRRMELRRQGMSEHYERCFRRKDGQPVWVLASAAPIFDDEHRFQGTFAMLTDITERKLVEKVLTQYAAIVESTDDAIVGKTLDGVITSWNKGAERMLGYRADEVIGHSIASLIPDDHQTEEQEILAKIRHGESVRHYETVRRCKDGHLIDVSITVSPLKNPKGEIVGASKIARDITERKQSEEELRKYRERLEELVSERTMQLEAANNELEEISYSTSHDLRTPLRAIDGFSRLLATKYAGQLDDEAQRLIRVVRDNAARMSQLIDDMLAFSRFGRGAIHQVPVDMRQQAEAAWLDLEPLRAGRDIRLTMQDLPPVPGDPAMLRQVWMNLLTNAVKFTGPRSSAHIEIGCDQDAEAYTYYVKDDGVGFDQNYGHKLFGVFQRLHAIDEFEGTGIGLAIVKRIVARHGGSVSAEGKAGEGAIFRFTLPKKGGHHVSDGECG